MKTNALPILLSVALITSACGGKGDNDESGYLPDDETLYLPTPEEVGTASGGLTATAGRGLCATDARAYDELKALVDEHNAEIKAYLDLLKSLRKQAIRRLERAGSIERKVTGAEGRSLTLVANLEADGSISYVVTFDGPARMSYKLLEGSTAPDRNSGTWSFYKFDGSKVITVEWSKDGDTLDVTRTIVGANASASFHREGDTASITVMGPNKSAMIVWSVSTKAGSISVNGDPRLCWDASLCTIECPAGN